MNLVPTWTLEPLALESKAHEYWALDSRAQEYGSLRSRALEPWALEF